MATRKASSPSKLVAAESAIAKAALAYPETHEDNPWGHRVFKVKGKAFLFLGNEDNELGLSFKLPHSNAVALELPFAEPTRYGLGKSGWVSARFVAADDVPVGLMLEWMDESFRAIAPKKVVAALPSGSGESTSKTPVPSPRPARPRNLPKRSPSVAAKSARKVTKKPAKKAAKKRVR